MKTVTFIVNELSEAYAFKTLHDYLCVELKEVPIEFTITDYKPGITKDLRKDLPPRKRSSPDVYVNIFSDVGIGYGWSCSAKKALLVDASVLKNCAMPFSIDAKTRLRHKHDICSDRSILVVSYAESLRRYEEQRLEELQSKMAVVAVGTSRTVSDSAIEIERVVLEYGVLKDYYSLADMVIDASSLRDSGKHMHNFVEATEGGPLFIVPGNTAQYGYRQFVECGAIHECASLKEIVERLKAYECEQNKEMIAEKRREHLFQSSKLYLPVIKASLLRLLGEPVDIPPSDLIVVENNNKIIIAHPDTMWWYSGLGSGDVKKFEHAKKERLAGCMSDIYSEVYANLSNKNSAQETALSR